MQSVPDYQATQLAVESDGAIYDESRPPAGFRPAPAERRCSEPELLHYMLEAEATRQDLERSTNDLRRLMEQSAKATREAQTAARSKSDFLAMMSHEIRTPLNGIIGMTSVLLSSPLGVQERDCLETIRSSGEALLSIIDGLLDFSKIEAGRLELEAANFEPAQLIAQTLQIVRGVAASKALALRSDVDPALPEVVRGDMVRLRQVLLNLLGNAVKFTDSGTIDLKAELLSASDTHYSLRFSVVDQGIGVSEEQQRGIFQPFTQANASTARKYGGTGLGLAISKQIVELMDGTIGVNSRPGEGSTFWFTVKLFRPERVAMPAMTPAERAGLGFRILLVEDNPLNQKVAISMLENLGYHVDLANDGREALRSVACQSYDLILMDCRMPEMDGFEATRRIRSSPGERAGVPIIAMTAGASNKDREDCFAVGMTDFLAKPVREIDLQEKLQHWLSSCRRQTNAC